ncbi:MAG: carboxymuconolactone decarboxylase family protein [Nannocystales bacterium]
MPRIAPLEAPYPQDVVDTFSRLMPPGMEPLSLFRTLAHNPRVLRRIQRSGLLDPGSISVRQREIVILRSCAQCDAHYEWGVHATLFGGTAGLDDAQLEATWTGLELESWTDDERALLRLCDELHETSRVSDATWASVHEHFEDAACIELVTLAGLYHAVSFLVNVTEVAAEPWARKPPARLS